uniref:GCVT N-terminal domain-containing protein n=1 Tax=Meloidogyne enterolobii TaxID=390850 RepID=A0A6V7XN81_MELEN|nr:unnamed protein product [Meloidogyne enterolobii]
MLTYLFNFYNLINLFIKFCFQLMQFLSKNFRHFSSLASSSIKKTCLYDFHIRNGAKMVEFAGYLMPGQYNNLSIMDSVKYTRSNVGIFDISHMLQVLPLILKHSEYFLDQVGRKRQVSLKFIFI